ncbi:MAG: hypothetical protein ACLFUH_01825 [Bacteroidales bacterium]
MEPTTKYYQKVRLYGPGHPQIPHKFFGVHGTDEQIDEFFDDHETTHAKFVEIDYSEIPSEVADIIPIYNCNF